MVPVPRPRRLLLGLVAAFLILPVAGAAASPRNDYPAKLAVTGKLTITTDHDFTGSCEPGQGWTVEASAEVNVHGRIELERIGKRIVQSTDAKTPGGAVNDNRLSGFRETNYCDEPVELPPPPRCARFAGTGSAALQPDPDGRAPWRVAVGIARLTGGEQDTTCNGWFVNRAQPTGTQLEALQSRYEGIVLPLDLSVSEFAKLPVNKKLKSKVKISGPCAGASAQASVYRDDVCRVSGSFTVVVQRLPGKGRGVSLARPW